MSYPYNSYQNKHLYYTFCDDWTIVAEDSEGNRYYVITELWSEWAKHPPETDQENYAIEKYMLPHAILNWTQIAFEPEEHD